MEGRLARLAPGIVQMRQVKSTSCLEAAISPGEVGWPTAANPYGFKPLGLRACAPPQQRKKGEHGRYYDSDNEANENGFWHRDFARGCGVASVAVPHHCTRRIYHP